MTLDDARKNCVIASFDSDSDVKSYTLAAVEGGVVENRDDEKNETGYWLLFCLRFIAERASRRGKRPTSGARLPRSWVSSRSNARA